MREMIAECRVSENNFLPPKKEVSNRGFETFENFYINYEDKVRRIVRSRIKKSCDVDDLVQDVFLRIWEFRSKIDQEKSIQSLLYRVTLNTVYNYIRHENVIRKFEQHWIYTQFSLTDSVDSVLCFNDVNSRLKTVLQECPEKQKEVFKLFWEKGLSRRQIAQKKGLSVRTIDNQLYRARTKMKQEFAEIY